MSEHDVELPNTNDEFAADEADRYEQELPVTEPEVEADETIPDDVDPADAHEQQLAVELDDDDYR